MVLTCYGRKTTATKWLKWDEREHILPEYLSLETIDTISAAATNGFRVIKLPRRNHRRSISIWDGLRLRALLLNGMLRPLLLLTYFYFGSISPNLFPSFAFAHFYCFSCIFFQIFQPTLRNSQNNRPKKWINYQLIGSFRYYPNTFPIIDIFLE